MTAAEFRASGLSKLTPDELTAVHPRIAIRDTIIALSFAGSDTAQRAIRIGVIKK